MKNKLTKLALLITLLVPTLALADRYFNSSNLLLGEFSDVKCSSNVTCAQVSGKLNISVVGLSSGFTGSITGDGGDTLSGFLRPVVAATATTITAAQCGSVFTNASAAIEMELPEASTVIGCELRFIVGSANNLTIDPDAADQILLLTNAAGDSLAADAAGESACIIALTASTWAPCGAVQGTWTDSN